MKAQKIDSFSEIALYLLDATRRTFIRCNRWSDNVWMLLDKRPDSTIAYPYFWDENTESFAKIGEIGSTETIEINTLIYEDWYVCFG